MPAASAPLPRCSGYRNTATLRNDLQYVLPLTLRYKRSQQCYARSGEALCNILASPLFVCWEKICNRWSTGMKMIFCVCSEVKGENLRTIVAKVRRVEVESEWRGCIVRYRKENLGKSIVDSLTVKLFFHLIKKTIRCYHCWKALLNYGNYLLVCDY